MTPSTTPPAAILALIISVLVPAGAMSADTIAIGDMNKPGAWLDYQWNRAESSSTLSDDFPPGVQVSPDRQKSLAVTIDWPGGEGFAFSKIDPSGAGVSVPYRMSAVSLWVKGSQTRHNLEIHFAHQGRGTTADGKEMKLGLGTMEGSGWRKLEAGIPEDWPQPLEIVSIVQHSWGEPAGGAVTGHYAHMEATVDRSVNLIEQAQADKQAQRQEAERLAREAALARPIETVEPFGRLSLVDEIDCSSDGAEHEFVDYPAGASGVETILGRQARVLSTVEGTGSYIAYRLGRGKGLRAGGNYVIAVEYPEDKPRSMFIFNRGNETKLGMHTGITVGDALHPKFVNNHVESLNMPLSGGWEHWTLLIGLHDRTEGINPGQGDEPKGRLHAPEDGFHVIISQMAARHAPKSAGIAVSRIRLFEVVDDDQLKQPLVLPPGELPRRRISWREEMSDGVIYGDFPGERGVEDRLDWYRFKVRQMRFLGINTYTKDLLEFGANQHWDSTPYGGNEWVFFDANMYHLWAQIVELMGKEGFDILPYYEYAGSKGVKGLGPQRRAKPLTRDDAYTHVRWVESAVADITDPDTYEDFAKMLDLTVLRFRDKANFAGIWVRPRQQLPVSFADATRERFANEANDGSAVSRQMLIDDKELYQRYIAWWGGKRRDFLVAMRQHLIEGGITDPMVLFTGVLSESGVGLDPFEPIFPTDTPEPWRRTLARPEHGGRLPRFITPQQVAREDLYLKSLLSPRGNWGDWEWHHSGPADDPHSYQDVEGVMMTHAFHRLYTVLSPCTFDTYRTGSGLSIVRHYTLNEYMVYDSEDKYLVGYFVADVERTGRHCMMGEVFAMANGDPTHIGYLVGANFGRGFPGPVREFNANYLALPALPSRIIAGASDDPQITVRIIETDGHGKYAALVHTGLAPKSACVKLPPGNWRQIVSGEAVATSDGVATFDLKPLQLLSLHSSD